MSVTHNCYRSLVQGLTEAGQGRTRPILTPYDGADHRKELKSALSCSLNDVK